VDALRVCTRNFVFSNRIFCLGTNEKKTSPQKATTAPLEARNSAHGGVGERLPNVSDGTEAVSAREAEMGLRGV
jgi:hypothetical protein